MKKECLSCKITKSFEDFNKQSRAKDGLQRYCRSCQSEKNKLWMVQNSAQRKDYEKSYKELNKNYITQQKKVWDQDNFEHRKQYRQMRRAYYAERGMHRLACMKNATPPWLTKRQLEEIKQFYWLSEDLFKVSGQKYNVDHIIPLQGKGVCGLHVPWNLQVLPKDINVSKGNRLDSSCY